MISFSSLFSSDGLFCCECYFNSTGFFYIGVLATFRSFATSRGAAAPNSLLSSFLGLNGSLALKSTSASFLMAKLSLFCCLAFSYCFCNISCFILFYSSFLYKADAFTSCFPDGDLSSIADFRAGAWFGYGFLSWPRMPPFAFSWPFGNLLSEFFSFNCWGDLAGPMIFFSALLINAGLF